jgi:hypothetical protein
VTNTEQHNPIPGLDQLRAAADARVRQQIADAAERREQQGQTRDEFAQRRQRGLRTRHAAKQARMRLADRFDALGDDGSDGDDAA